MWKAYYRRQPARLMALLIQANREQAGASWPRAIGRGVRPRAGARRGSGAAPATTTASCPTSSADTGCSGLPDAGRREAVARRELRWWVVRREIGLAAGRPPGDVIADLYAELYAVPGDDGRRGRPAARRSRRRCATAARPPIPTARRARGTAYWPEVARLLRDSYRSLSTALGAARGGDGRAAVRPANDYGFLTTWRLPATREEIAALLGDAAALSRWWPSVYLSVEEVEPGDETGVGKVVDLYTKGWLPYTLRWRFRVTASDPPAGFALGRRG